jgi:GNAT superfamily N-acetyltransferase
LPEDGLPRLTVVEQPGEEVRAIIGEPLLAHNREAGPPTEPQPVAILVHDEAGRAVGGLYGRSFYDWLFVEWLAIPKEMRGRKLGTALMARAEDLARERQCLGVFLDTFSFQARGFYEKLGYAVFGTLEDHPRGGARYFMSKRL